LELSLIARLIREINIALQPPLIKPVSRAMETFNQEAFNSNQITFIVYLYNNSYLLSRTGILPVPK
jgi:hypothetical protein